MNFEHCVRQGEITVFFFTFATSVFNIDYGRQEVANKYWLVRYIHYGTDGCMDGGCMDGWMHG